MKLFHISDLHIGKQLHYYNLKDLQTEILCQIVEMAREHRPDVILIAGDIYDKSIPSGEAYEIFDQFLNRLADITPSIPVLIIAGNHDSAMRLKFASSFLDGCGAPDAPVAAFSEGPLSTGAGGRSGADGGGLLQ